jgi:thiol-disulfide isomerase/thioredoxin
VAAILALILIAFVIYTFTHLSAPTSVRSFPDVTIDSTYRQTVPHFEWSNGTNHLKNSDLEGGWTLLSFWSATCPPCLTEMPDLDQFNEDWSGPELAILTVNIDGPTPEAQQAVKDFLAENEIQLPVYYDPEEILKKKFDVTEIPHHFLIDPKGVIRWHSKGAFNWTSAGTEKALMTVMESEKNVAPPAEVPDDEADEAK